MPAPRISSALVHRVATGLQGTGAAAVIEDIKRGVRITIVANGGQAVLPSPDAEENEWDKAVGIEP
jgi:hypothetical protein